MTSVFSGGIVYEFYDSPDIQSCHWGYGLVRVEDTVVGKGLTKLSDYHSLKSRLAACEETMSKQRWPTCSTDGEGRGRILQDPPPLSSHWKAGHALPYSLADWSGVRRNLDGKLWVEVEIQEVENARMNTQPRSIRA